MDKAERLLDLVALLLGAREPISFSELRELFPEEYGGNRSAAERKLERDKAELQALGVPVEYVQPELDEREVGGYRIDRKAFFLPDPKLLPEESAALYAAGAAALQAHDFPFAQDLQHALRKISLAGERSIGAASARRLLIVRPGGDGKKLAALGDAVARRKRVHLVYEAPPGLDGTPGERTERDVDPWGLAFRGGAWRLLGYDHLRKAQRTFVVGRIESVQINAHKPASPDFAPPEDFDAGAAAGKRPWLWAQEKPQIVQLRGNEALLDRVFGTADGRLTVSYLDGLIPQVLALGDAVHVESPDEAREKAASALRRLRSLLQEPVDPLPNRSPPKSKSAPEPAQLPRESRAAQDRLRRLLLVVPAARRRPGIKLPDLARELQLDEAQLRDDIELLAVVGRPPFSPDDLIDISVDERDRVTVTLDQSFSRPPQLTALESLALAAAAQEVAPADPQVTSALAKLTEKLTPQAQNLYKGLARRLAAATPPPRGAEEILARLRAAAENHREVKLAYDKEGRGQAQERILRPHGLIDHGGVWYAIGLDAQKGAERTFRVDRVLSVEETDASFADPGPLDAARFQREELYFPSGREIAVVLRFSATAAAWAVSRYGDRAERLPDGRADVWLETENAASAYARSLALSFAGEAQIVAPEEARRALREEVERALQRYS